MVASRQAKAGVECVLFSGPAVMAEEEQQQSHAQLDQMTEEESPDV